MSDTPTPGPVPEPDAKRLVSAVGIPVPRGATAVDPGDVARAAAGLGTPLVVKAFGPGIVHKSDIGAVRLNLAGPEEAATAAAEMRAALATNGHAPAGFLVEEQASPGVEVIVGAVRDPAFGPVLMAGLGGVWAEALGDTALRLCPVERADAERMLAELRGAPLLDGARGGEPVDRAALADLLVRIGGRGGLVERLGPDLAEFELNPVLATRHGVTAVDARLLLAEGAPTPVEPPAPAPPAPQPPVPDLTRLFAPRGVAVAGASTSRPGFGNMFLAQYRAAYPGTLRAVHPTAEHVDGVPAVPSLRELAGRVDYALVAVPATACPPTVRDAKGIPFVQVMSGGFRETGAAGAELEDELRAAARESGTRLLGPNCMGVYCPASGQTFVGGEPGPPGRISVVSQSGGLAGEVVTVGERRGLRFAKVATVGNSADLTPAELVRYLADDPETGVLGLYLEDPRDGRALFEALRAACGRLPVVALVGGRSAQGRRAAASHTGSMISDARVWRALGEQCGVALVDGQDALIGALDLLDLHARRPAGGDPDVLVAGPSGGASVLAADVFDAAGMRLTPLGARTRAGLRELGLGAGTALANPLEIPVGPRGRVDLVRRSVEAACAEVTFPDVVAHLNAQSFWTYAASPAAGREALLAHVGQLVELQSALPGSRVTLVVRNPDCGPDGLLAELRAAAREGGIPVFPTMEAAASAIHAAKTFTRARQETVPAASPR